MSKEMRIEPIEPPKRRRGADPLDAIDNPEVRAFAIIERAFESLSGAGKRRMAWLVADKYGPVAPSGE